MELRFLLGIIRIGDYDFKVWAKKKLSKLITENAAKYVYEAVKAKELADSRSFIAKLICLSDIEFEKIPEMISLIIESRKKEKFTISEIMKMYHSEDSFLVQKSKECIVTNYSNYVHDIIHTSYPTYAEKYEEELYHSGLMGLIIAMKNYSEEKGAFTTYSKMFIRHEINEQLNYHNNNTTVHYNGVQKKIADAINKICEDGYEPTVNRIAIMAELKPEVVKRELDYIERTKFVYLDDNPQEADGLIDYNTSPERIAIENERDQCLLECVESLPPDIRKVVWMVFLTDSSYEKIAKELNLSAGQVRNNMKKGLDQLRSDSRLCEVFSDYLGAAEVELAKYNLPVIPTKKELEQDLDDLLNLMVDNSI